MVRSTERARLMDGVKDVRGAFDVAAAGWLGDVDDGGG